MIICGTWFWVEKKEENQNTPEYKVPPHFWWSEQHSKILELAKNPNLNCEVVNDIL